MDWIKFLTCSIVTLNSSDLQDKYAAVTLKVVFKKFELQMNFQSNLILNNNYLQYFFWMIIHD